MRSILANAPTESANDTLLNHTMLCFSPAINLRSICCPLPACQKRVQAASCQILYGGHRASHLQSRIPLSRWDPSKKAQSSDLVDTKPYDAGQGWSVPVTEKQGLMSAVSLRIQTKKVLSARLALWDEADEDQKARSTCGCLPRESIDQSSSSTRVGVSHQARAYASVGATHPACDRHRPAIASRGSCDPIS